MVFSMLTIQSAGSSSLGNSYKISSGDSFLLIEAGVKLKDMREAFGYNLSDADGCLSTHRHYDHCKYLPELSGLGIRIYCSKETASAAGVSNSPFFKEIHHKKEFFVGEWQVYPFNVEHDCEGALGFHIIHGRDRLLFITDTAYCRYNFPGVNYLMIEANFHNQKLERNFESGLIDKGRRKRILDSHFSLERVKEYIVKSDTSKLVSVFLMHLSETNSDESLFKEEIQKITGVPVHVFPA